MKTKMFLLMIVFVGVSLGQAPEMRGRMNPQNMDAIRIWKLTEVLELNEDQVVTFLPLVQIHERRLREIQGEIKALSDQANSLMEQEGVTQKQVDKFIKSYSEKQGEIYKIKNDFVQSLPEHLTPKQQLIYLGFETRFRSELREYMKNERHGSRTQNKRESKRQ